MRLGLPQPRRPVVEADDWVWMADRSIRLGRDRPLAVPDLKVTRDPDRDGNRDEPLAVARRTGVPRVLLSDQGADLRGGIRLLGEVTKGAAALRRTPVKAVRNWRKQNIGTSTQSKRQQAFRLAGS